MPAEETPVSAVTDTPTAPPSEGDVTPVPAKRSDPRKLLASSDVPAEVIEQVFGKEEPTVPNVEPTDSVEDKKKKPPVELPGEQERKEDAPAEEVTEVPGESPVEPETEPEPETAEAKGEKDDEDDEELEGETVPKHVFQKRVDKLTRQKIKWRDEADELRGRLEAAEKQLEKAQQVTAPPTPTDPLSDVTDVEGLNAKVTQAKAMRSWCRRNTQGAVLNEGTDKERVVTPEEVAEWMDHYDSVIEAAPEKKEKLKARGEWDGVARQAFPVIFDKKTEEYQFRQQLLREMPEVSKLPDANLRVGIYLLGLRTFQKAIEDSKKGKKSLSIPKSPPIAPSTPKPPSSTVTPSHSKNVEDATKEAIESGADPQALLKLIHAKRMARMEAGGKQTVLP